MASNRTFTINGHRIVTSLRVLTYADVLRYANMEGSAVVTIKKSQGNVAMLPDQTVTIEEGMSVSCHEN